MKHSNVTIKFLAEVAGVSFSTVAKALHDDPAINIETRMRIQKIAREYNYRPNILAKGLRNRRTKSIGVILNDLQSPFYSEIYKAIGDVLHKNGYTMFLADSKYDEAIEKQNISTMIGQGVEGLIVSSVSEDSENIELLLQESVKTVFIDNRPRRDDICCVYVDHEAAANLAVSHLIGAGHRNILLLNGPENLPSSQRYMMGYCETLKSNNIVFREELVKFNAIDIAQTSRLLANILNGNDAVKPDDFTAIVTLSDVTAIGVYEAAMTYGFTIPGTYSLVGYDNIFATKYLNPALTTIHQPKEQTGRLASTMLLNCIEDPDAKMIQIILNPELKIRASVRSLL
ncbi:MAG: LacI family DNA-binding transcriptional regulator [Sphaerochaeta sp.]|nr:LacI family DNA-binding transcriptional regulator [Sphaerochaeta sp.]